MTKRYILISLLCCALMFLCGCGKPNAKTEDEIQNDLIINGEIANSDRTYHIDSFEITRRRTDFDSHTDVIFASIIATSDDGSIHHFGEYEITYGLYNDGWILDDVCISSEKIIPLQGSNFSTEDLALALVNYGFYQIDQIQIYSHETDLENSLDQYSLTVESTYAYASETIDATLTFFFDVDYGWVPANCTLDVNSSTITWHIAGEYYRSDGDRDNIILYDDFPVDFLRAMYSDTKSDYTSDVTSDLLFDAKAISEQTLLLNALNSWGEYDAKYIDDYGFSVIIEGDFYSLSDFDYVTYWNGGGNRFDGILYIGKDHLAFSERSNYAIDEYHGKIILDAWELIPAE